MKYISFAIVIIFICVVVGFWIKGSPKTEVPVDTTSDVKPAETTPTQETPKTTDIKKNKITMIQGMKIETTKEGSGPEITNGKTAVVHYTGKLLDGKVFDSSKTRGTPFEFPLGAGMVIKGWELGVLGMKVGEVRMLTIPSELGYGAQGAGGMIPPNATLVFEVELLGIK